MSSIHSTPSRIESHQINSHLQILTAVSSPEEETGSAKELQS